MLDKRRGEAVLAALAYALIAGEERRIREAARREAERPAKRPKAVPRDEAGRIAWLIEHFGSIEAGLQAVEAEYELAREALQNEQRRLG